MKLDITTKHLRVLNLLNFTEGKDLELMETLMGISRPNLNNYLKDIHKHIKNVEKTGKMDCIITDIIGKKQLYPLLKKKQTVSKEDRIFFLILKLLIEGTLNLDYLAELLNISRRTLNIDLLSIKDSLNVFELKIESHTGRGIFLDGNISNKRNALCCYIYKYLVEEEYLPTLFKTSFSYITSNYEISSLLNHDIEKFMKDFNFDTFFYNRILLTSFYISFKYLVLDPDEDMKNSYSLEIALKDRFSFETYFSKVFSKDEIDNFYNFLHNSVFKDIKFKNIGGFLNILKICSGNFPEESIYLKDHLSIWKDVVKTVLNKEISPEDEILLKNVIQRVSFSSKQKHYLYIYEFYFLNLNLDSYTSNKCISLFKEFRKYYWNISFTDVFAIYFILNSPKKRPVKEVTILYKNIPILILEGMKNEIEHKYNIVIKDFVNNLFFEEHRKNNHVSTVGIFGDIKLYDNFQHNSESLEIMYLDLKI
ncbi:HTH domain-containing protein [Cetobacterium sp.]|uniref:HTH domain-containing protein n=1 Tax=Cetobacterium sp. TaxID=2071632 RepID=UPI003F34D19B